MNGSKIALNWSNVPPCDKCAHDPDTLIYYLQTQIDTQSDKHIHVCGFSSKVSAEMISDYGIEKILMESKPI